MQHHLPPVLMVRLVLEYNLVIEDYYLKVRGLNERSHPHYFKGLAQPGVAIGTLLGSTGAHQPI